MWITLTAFAYWCGTHEQTFLPTIAGQPRQIEKEKDNGPRERRDGRWSRSVELQLYQHITSTKQQCFAPCTLPSDPMGPKFRL